VEYVPFGAKYATQRGAGDGLSNGDPVGVKVRRKLTGRPVARANA